jgi:adenylate cyclase
MTAGLVRIAGPFQDGDAVAAWLLNEAGNLVDTKTVIGGLVQRLVATGFPLYRLFLSVRTLHPQVVAIGYQWRRGDSLPSETPREYGIDREEIYLASPIKPIHDGVPEIRCRIGDPGSPQNYPILAELRAEGVTDYLALPVRFSGERINAMSVATDRPNGFTKAEIERIKALVPLLALVLEVKETRRISSTLLDTYLGHDAGRRVLGGLIRRGEGITIAAALWYCDLRNFTATTEALPRSEAIALLNEYFECMVGPVHRRGGEVLKFIGDALLAIFPMADDLDRDRACQAALAAAEDALTDLDSLNRRRQANSQPILEAGIALHAGSVTYGNVGAPDRLDFTVIGAAVNFVTRLERMCGQLGRPLLASAGFASPCGSKLVSIGHHRLRGMAQAQEIFALPPDATIKVAMELAAS